jgi:DnaJ-domain-containing protein 1
MLYAALGALILAFLAFDRRRLKALAGRGGWLILSLAAGAGALFAGLRGSWLGASLLLTAALWLGAGARPASKGPSAPSMRLSEARAMLGVSEGADAEEIEAAYRRLMRRVHPDLGGAPGLATQLNLARARLLGSKGRAGG